MQLSHINDLWRVFSFFFFFPACAAAGPSALASAFICGCLPSTFIHIILLYDTLGMRAEAFINSSWREGYKKMISSAASLVRDSVQFLCHRVGQVDTYLRWLRLFLLSFRWSALLHGMQLLRAIIRSQKMRFLNGVCLSLQDADADTFSQLDTIWLYLHDVLVV